MGFETIPGTESQYALVSFDVSGIERQDPAAPDLLSSALVKTAVRDEITNVFLFCHGWKGDYPAARDQYNLWIKALVDSDDRAQAEGVFSSFRPLFIGLHWPSQPWGDEEIRSGAAYAPRTNASSTEYLMRAYLDRLGDRPEVHRLLETIITEARKNTSPEELPPHIVDAYRELNDMLGLKSEGVGAPPDADRADWDPQDAYAAGNEAGASYGGGLDLGGLLGPLRQLSYWTMKKRARTVGEGGMHEFLKGLQIATQDRATRVHLMGHSFGTIVVSGMLGGPGGRDPLPRSVDSVVLVQGAVSLWCYSPSIPLRGAGPGYFHRILADKKVRGPVVTTRSKYDDAVGIFYPWASAISGSSAFAQGFPEFGAVGTYGLQGIADSERLDLNMLPAGATYNFARSKVYNLDGSKYICHKQGASGAHSDISGPEVAHAIWAAAFASV